MTSPALADRAVLARRAFLARTAALATASAVGGVALPAVARGSRRDRPVCDNPNAYTESAPGSARRHHRADHRRGGLADPGRPAEAGTAGRGVPGPDRRVRPNLPGVQPGRRGRGGGRRAGPWRSAPAPVARCTAFPWPSRTTSTPRACPRPRTPTSSKASCRTSTRRPWPGLKAAGAIVLGKTQMGPLATTRATTPERGGDDGERLDTDEPGHQSGWLVHRHRDRGGRPDGRIRHRYADRRLHHRAVQRPESHRAQAHHGPRFAVRNHPAQLHPRPSRPARPRRQGRGHHAHRDGRRGRRTTRVPRACPGYPT